MFLNSEITLPFETLKGVLSDPTWKLMVDKGNEAIYRGMAMDGDPDFIDFVKHMNQNPDKTFFSGTEEGLAKLNEGPNVIHIIEGMFNGFLHNNPFHQQSLKVFAKEKAKYDALIFPLNSPFREVMKLASTRMFENSAVEYLIQKWEGRGTIQTAGMAIIHLSFQIMRILSFSRCPENSFGWRSITSCLHTVVLCLWNLASHLMWGGYTLDEPKVSHYLHLEML